MKFLHKNLLKNNQGQVLLMVIITSTIALLLLTGMFMRVLRINRERFHSETHESAFSASEKYSRMILDALESGLDPDLTSWLSNDDLVAATINDLNAVSNVALGSGETYVISNTTSGITRFTVSPSTWQTGTERILFTRVIYSGGNYSIEKRIFRSCSINEGNLSGLSCAGNVFTYNHAGNEIALRVKVIGGDGVVFSQISSSGVLAKEFKLTTKSSDTGTGDHTSLSEIVLLVDSNTFMPSLFDHVVYNGKNRINK